MWTTKVAVTAGWLAVGAFALPGHYYSCTFNFTGGDRLPYPFCNPALSVDERIQDLISRMTMAEKAASLDTSNPAVERLGLPSLKASESTHGLMTACGEASLGSTGCPTSFPAGVGLGATFDRGLWSLIGETMGYEARGLNNQAISGVGGVDTAGDPVPGIPPNGKSGLYFLDPNINLQRDPRWGRSQEVPGEDPLVNAEYAAHLIDAQQHGIVGGKPRDERYLLTAATAKHFTMYDLEGYIPRTDPQPRPPSAECDTAGGCQRWNFDAFPPLNDFVDYYMPPFKAAVQRAKVVAMMCSYNAAYGVPTCAASDMNNDLARTEWDWDGFFISDCTALELMQDVKWDACQPPYSPGSCVPSPFAGHNYTGWCGPDQCPPNSKEGVGSTVNAALNQGGIDFNCGPLYKTNLLNALNYGAIEKEDIDRAVARVYRTHFRLGMLDPPADQFYYSLGQEDVDTQEARNLALRAAEESIVLLRNDGGILPLKRTTKIAFIGPHANSTEAMLSNYHGTNKVVLNNSPLMAARAAGLDVTYSMGTNICDYPYGKNPGFPNMPCPDGMAKDVSGIPEAVAAARAADVAVLFVGSDQTTEAENYDRKVLTLAGVQDQLVEAVLQANPETVIVLINGGPISLEGAAGDVPAVLEAFYPGELGGDAIINTLLGDSNKFGRMPVTTYHADFISRDIRDVDLAHGTGITYRHFDGPVHYPFGFGLSYTTFKFEWSNEVQGTRFGADELKSLGGVDYKVVVTNTGTVAGDCVVLAFSNSDNYKGTNRDAAGGPLRALVGFERLRDMKPNEARSVLFTVSAESVAVVDGTTGDRVLKPRRLSVEIGDGGASDAVRRPLEVTGDTTVLEAAGSWVAAHKKRLAQS